MCGWYGKTTNLWKPYRIELCPSINKYLQRAYRLYFSWLSKIFLLIYQLYFKWCINYIHSVNKNYIFPPKRFSVVLVLPKILNPSISPTWVQRVEFKGGITNYPQSVDRAPGARDLTVTTVGERNTVDAYTEIQFVYTGKYIWYVRRNTADQQVRLNCDYIVAGAHEIFPLLHHKFLIIIIDVAIIHNDGYWGEILKQY